LARPYVLIVELLVATRLYLAPHEQLDPVQKLLVAPMDGDAVGVGRGGRDWAYDKVGKFTAPNERRGDCRGVDQCIDLVLLKRQEGIRVARISGVCRVGVVPPLY